MLNYRVNTVKGVSDIIPIMVGRDRCAKDMSKTHEGRRRQELVSK